MNVGAITYNILSNDATLTAIISTRIYPVKAPQGDVTKCVVYNRVSTDSEFTKEDYHKYDVVTMQIASYAKQYGQVIAIAEAVRGALVDSNGTTVGAVTVDRIFFENQTDLYDDETQIYGIYQDFTFRLKQ